MVVYQTRFSQKSHTEGFIKSSHVYDVYVVYVFMYTMCGQLICHTCLISFNRLYARSALRIVRAMRLKDQCHYYCATSHAHHSIVD